MTKKKVKKEVPVEENIALRYNEGKPEISFILDLGPSIVEALCLASEDDMYGDSLFIVPIVECSKIYQDIKRNCDYDDVYSKCVSMFQYLYCYTDRQEIFVDLAQVFAYDAIKYKRDNWKKGLSYPNLLNSASRHLLKYESGRAEDDESKLSHAAHAVWNLCILLYFYKIECDKRNKK